MKENKKRTSKRWFWKHGEVSNTKKRDF